jgi:hypothetical protein
MQIQVIVSQVNPVGKVCNVIVFGRCGIIGRMPAINVIWLRPPQSPC